LDLGAVAYIVHRLTCIEARIKALEDNPLLVAYREFHILEAKRIFDPEEQHKRFEKQLKDMLSNKEGN